MLFVVLEKRSVKISRIDDLVVWLQAQNKGAIHTVISDIAVMLNPEETDAHELDDIFHNHQMFCAHVERYLVLKEAIKYGDIGLLRHGLRHAMVLFNSGVTSTPKYAQGLLYMIHMVDSSATTEDFQRFVLANMLVNLRGKADGFIENDRCLELENNRHRKHITRRTMMGAPDSDQNIGTWALMGRMLDKFRTALQLSFGWRVNRDHTYKNAYEDIFAMAQYLAGASIRPYSGARQSLYRAANLVQLAYKRIPDAIGEYNKKYCQSKAFEEQPSNSDEDISPEGNPLEVLQDSELTLLDPNDDRLVFDDDWGLPGNEDLDGSFTQVDVHD